MKVPKDLIADVIVLAFAIITSVVGLVLLCLILYGLYVIIKMI